MVSLKIIGPLSSSWAGDIIKSLSFLFSLPALFCFIYALYHSSTSCYGGKEEICYLFLLIYLFLYLYYIFLASILKQSCSAKMRYKAKLNVQNKIQSWGVWGLIRLVLVFISTGNSLYDSKAIILISVLGTKRNDVIFRIVSFCNSS